MTYFKLDIQKLSEISTRYKNSKKNYLENLDVMYSSLKNVDVAWNDSNTATFIDILNKDKLKIAEYFDYTGRVYSQMRNFVNKIESIYIEKTGVSNISKIKFDDNEISDCKKKLNLVIMYLNNAIYELEKNAQFSNIRYKTIGIRNSVNELIGNIDSIVSLVNEEIDNSKYLLKKIENPEYNLNEIKYKGKLIDMTE